MPDPGLLVRLRGIHKVFANGTVALRELSLGVGHHEFVSLLGPSGCGKSTALRLIAGLSEATAGSIEWPGGGAPGAGAAPGRSLGFVFQEPTLMPWATVFGNVALPLRLQGVPTAEIRARVRQAIRMVGLDGFEAAYPRALSGGMKMRASIARALVTRPQLLLMDEPFAALDEITRTRLNDDLLALWAGQRWTVVFVTHSIFESVYLSQRIVVMAARPGRVVADIPIDALYPRDESFRTSAAYNEYCRRVSAALRQAMGVRGDGAAQAG
ncbi:MAG: ABC transporter ATP-binding protein [Candidatus Rokuibacteriota bacterium]